MPWAKVDDQLHAHPKWRRASKGARALWTTALSWCSSRPSDGHVPADMLRLLDGTRAEAACLVRVGLWDVTDDGYVFHEWAERNPDASSVRAGLDRKSQGGKRGNHTKWHVNRGVRDAECEFCASHTDRMTDSPTDRVSTRPVPTRPDPTDTETPTESLGAASAGATTTPTKASTKRGTRIPEPFPITPDMVEWARKETPHLDHAAVTARFVDYWTAESGAKAVKLDWVAAWRNWLRREQDNPRGGGRLTLVPGGGGPSPWDRVFKRGPQ